MSPVSSFRDPAGFCFTFQEKVLRVVAPGSVPEVEVFLSSASARRLLEAQQLIPTRRLKEAEAAELLAQPAIAQLVAGRTPGAVYEHQRVSFPSFPYEWPPEMLFAAGQLTLQLAQATLADGFCLKDATPYNVLFEGGRPVFVDLLSFERRAPGDPLWRPYAQFIRTFLLPLLANQQWSLKLADVFLNHRDGLEPEEVYRMCGVLQRLTPPWLTLVSLPAWLAAKGEKSTGLYQSKLLPDVEKARFILESLFKSLQRRLGKLQPPHSAHSTWSGYMESHSYTDENFTAKEQFVRQVVEEFRPRQVLDVGANTGHFSRLAAQSGASVVAIDYDPACMGHLWSHACAENLDILPLVVNLARPSPALGWRNQECPAFLERAAGRFDAVLMLAVLHHLLVTERVPLEEVLQLAATLTTEWLVIEFVGPGDKMFQTIARGREQLFAGLDQKYFEKVSSQYFEIVRHSHFDGTQRWLYLLRKR